jgi:Glycosyltransferases involved in cell wall biogenesis
MNDTISVIITAHDRKKYLKNAVQSVLNQQIEKSHVQIIVVKNFSDNSIDLFLEENGVTNIYTTEKSFGMKLSVGIDNATGGIITFLDDDDLFTLNKLDAIKSIFDEKRDTVYVHNGILNIGEDENPFDKAYVNNNVFTVNPETADWELWGRSMTMRGDWYVSCISLNGEFAKQISHLLKTAVRSLDKVIYLCAASSGKKMVFTNDKLTFYRKHESLTGIKSSPDEFMARRFQFTVDSIETMKNVEKLLQFSSDFIPYEIITLKLEANKLLYEKGKRRESMIMRRRLLTVARKSNNRESKMLASLHLIRFFSVNLAFRLFRHYQIKDI